jgi:hypothetical protein
VTRPVRVLVTGSTTWTDADAIRRELSVLPAGTVVVHGDCPGVDAFAGEVAATLGLTVERWEKNSDDHRKYRRAAWKGLNERMLASGVSLLFAFHPDWDVEGKARGTRHLLALARAAGIDVRAFDR